MDNTIWVLNVHGGHGGHHDEYYAVFEKAFGARRRNLDRHAVFSRKPVLVPIVEASTFNYTALCLIRSFLGLHTAGLLFRPLPTLLDQSWRTRIKRWALKLVRRLPRVATLTIMPFSVEPRFAEIAHDWIHDLQFWDLHYPLPMAQDRAEGPLAGALRETAAGRAICCAIGRQDHDKGFDLFAQAYAQSETLRAKMLFAFGGKVAAPLADAAADFEAAGGLARARFIDHDELLDLYACADLIWACYAPQYDQASGIFGRAMQMGLPVVVRNHSLLHRLCRSEGLPHIAFDPAMDPAVLAQVPLRQDPAMAAERARAMGLETAQKLRRLLGLAPVSAPAAE